MLIDKITQSDKSILELLDDKQEVKKSNEFHNKENTEHSETDYTKKEKDKEKQSLDLYPNEIKEFDESIVKIFRDIELFIFNAARGNIGLASIKFISSLLSTLFGMKKKYSKTPFLLRGPDKTRLLGIYKRIFTFNRTFLLNSLTNDPIKKKGFTNLLNNK